MEAIVLCGGMGTRLRVVTGSKPKVLAEVSGQPFLAYILEQLRQQHFKRVILCTGYAADDVETVCKKHAGHLDLVFSREEKPLGTGGAVKKAQPYVRFGHFIVLNGDSICPIDLFQLKQFHLKHQALATITATKVSDASDYGTIEVGENSTVVQFSEKNGQKTEGLVNAGVYCFDKNIFNKMPSDEAFSLERDVFPNLISQGLFAYVIDENFMDIGTPERYRKAQDKLKT